MREHATRRNQGERGAVIRWECRCQEPPVLLGTYDSTGKVNIKVRDRYWHVIGEIWTTCPRCGAEHTLPPEMQAPDLLSDAHTSVASTP